MITRRRGRRRDTESPLRTLIKGGVTLVIVAFVIWFGVTSYNGIPFRHYSTLYVDVPQIGNLNVHDPVRVAGVQVGQVMGETVTPKGYARVKLQLNPGTSIPADSGVAIRANGLLGARYVQLILGSSHKRAPAGGTITGGANALTFGVPETLQTLDRPTRTALGSLIDGVGTGMLGHGEQLNTAIHALAGAAPRFTALARAILARGGALRRLVPSLDTLMTPLDQARLRYGELLAPAAHSLQVIADERPAVQASLSDAPDALASATHGLARSQELLAAVSALARSAVHTLPMLPAGLRATAQTMRQAPAPLAAATRLLRSAVPAVPATLKITSALSPTLTPLQDALANADPMIVSTGQHACDIVGFGTNFRSMTGFGGVGNGPLGPNSAGEFRAQLLPAAEVLAPLGALLRPRQEAYARPCLYPDNASAAAPTPLTRSPGGR